MFANEPFDFKDLFLNYLNERNVFLKQYLR